MLKNRFASGVFMDGEPGSGGGDGKTAPVTLEVVNTAINGAIAKLRGDLPGVIKDSTKGFETSLTQLTENLTTLNTTLQANKGGDGKSGDGKSGDGKSGDDGLTPETRARFANLEKLLKTANDGLTTEKTAREVAEKKSRETTKQAAVREALGQFTYASPEAAEDAFTLVVGRVDFDDQGNLVADGLPVKDFVTSFIPEKKSHLLRATGTGGAGAQSGQQRGGVKVDIDDIKVSSWTDAKGDVQFGLKPETQTKAISAIIDALDPNARAKYR